MHTRLIAFPALVLALVLSLATSALAAAPPSGPVLLRSVDFESVPPADVFQVYNDFGGFPAGPATWGRITQQHGPGSAYGLWCAGASATWGNYPAGTRGLAVLSVPDCSEWAESTIRYSYVEPTAESFAGGANPFWENWVDASDSPTGSTPGTAYSSRPWRLTSEQWTTVDIPRGEIGNPPMSSGYLRFQFVSNPMIASTGQGATIDDISVTGYKFAAVNNLTAARQRGALSTVVVDWDAPLARGTTSTADPREIWYRVWRHDMSTNAWTEVTSSRVNTTTFTDTDVPLDGTYQYTVSGWDGAGESAWGKNATSGSVGVAVPHFVSATMTPTSVKYGGGSTLRAVLLDGVGEPMDGVVRVQRQLTGGGWTTLANSVSRIETGTYSAYVASTVSANYRLYYSATGAVSSSIRVSAPAYLTTPSTPSSVKRNRSFTLSGKVSGVPGLSRSVKLSVYRKKSATVWSLYTSAVVRVSASSGVVSYRKSLKLKAKGSYRVCATVADVHSAWTKSSYRYFSAK